jgi:hypothetical protein
MPGIWQAAAYSCSCGPARGSKAMAAMQADFKLCDFGFFAYSAYFYMILIFAFYHFL